MVLAVVAWMVTATLVGAMVGGGAPRAPGTPYAPRPIPDRIVLTPGADPAREMAVAWRTDAAQSISEAQIVRAVDSPSLDSLAKTVVNDAPPRPLASANGEAHFHSVRFSDLEPDTVYGYRLKGAAGWTEWFQFKTAAAEARPFRFLYLGDVQNGILSDAARVIRQAFSAHGGIEAVLHAGDLVDQRGALDHDDEWGEWNAAAGHHYAMIPQIPAAGNHEYDNLVVPERGFRRRLGRYWPLQFALPANGAPAVRETTYFVDYQGVRFIVLDGTAALDLGAIETQTRWLDQTLATSGARWNVVLFHQPVFSCGRAEDASALQAAWKPVFESRQVDLVLQGHDHCYSRVTSAPGRASLDGAGPVYLVSVAGSKMYGLNDRAVAEADRAAEATQLYQIVDVMGDRLSVRVFTATGRLYDGFDIERQTDGRKFVRESTAPLVAERLCDGATGPDGAPCGVKTKKLAAILP
jgi:hypothetical protein